TKVFHQFSCGDIAIEQTYDRRPYLHAVHSMVETRRLYVSPLDPDLLPILLPGPLRDSACNITYHTLQTLPERPYGYLDLPVLEADRLQKKLHNAILKGVKMKVEKARPEKPRPIEGSQDEEDNIKDSKPPRRSRSARQNGLLEGVELSDGRTVKRGWTDPAVKEGKHSTRRDKKEQKPAIQIASAHTDGPECLFKTKLPRNAVTTTTETSVQDTKPKKRKRGQSERDVLVHEFDKTTKQATFLREDRDPKGQKTAASYREGKGWLDQDGNILEKMDEARLTRQKARERVGATEVPASTPGKAARETKTRAGRSKRPESNEELAPPSSSTAKLKGREGVARSNGQTPDIKHDAEVVPDDQTSSEGSDSSDTDDEVNTEQVRGLSISRLSPTPPLVMTKEVHPLEALFKRPQTAASQTPKKPSLEVKTGFSFFEPDEEPVGNTTVAIPQTPFTQQDFQERRLRSAAPTPDTAAPGKTSFGRVWSAGSGQRDSGSDEEDEEDIPSTPRASEAPINDETQDEPEESEFAKWFYEHRDMTSSVLTIPTSPSVFDRDPRSPNSWTGRSFTTLLPSDSPSQALFPKYSQASILLAARNDNATIPRPRQELSPLGVQQRRQHSFAKRNLYFIISAAILQLAMIVLTTLLVLIITAATSKPRRRINPSYYFGIMFSIAASVASIIVIWIKYSERQNSSLNRALHSPTSPLHNDNDIELGRLPVPQATVRGAVSNWDDQDLRSPGALQSFMAAHIPHTTASARIAGSNNHLAVPGDANLTRGIMHNEPPQHQQHDSSSTAAALQRLLENELQRQEKIRRRISSWLRGLPAPPAPPVQSSSAPKYPPPPIPLPPIPPQQRKPADPTRLAELDREIESYLGFPAPTLFTAKPGKAPKEKDDVEERGEDGDEDEDENIDYDTLPPAIPRQGARSRKALLSDPITVLHVGPMRQKGSPLVREVG
ncbi:MAG: hypothetical protein Q9168_008242, partial [Polycauliona sp. 1 TL-2023]